MLSDATRALGRRVAAALRGVDALYRAESGDADGLVVLDTAPEADRTIQDFVDYAAASDALAAIRRNAADLPEPDRQAYYEDACDSTLAFVEWRRRGMTFTQRLSSFLHVPAEPPADPELETLRHGIQDMLETMGLPRDLGEGLPAWEEGVRVPTADVPDVLAALLDEAWDRTQERLLEIPTPKSDGMRVQAVSGVAFNARCDYARRTIELNTDPVLTRPGLKHLAVHEGCPGHYVQFTLRETMAAAGQAAEDVRLSVVNSASSCVFEGIADAGLHMLDWIESDDDRLQALLNRYRAGVATSAAWRMHALGWDRDRVGDWLRERAPAGGEGWIANRLAFIEAPARAVLIWSYWWGEPVVTRAWDRVPAHRRSDFLAWLHGRMHSNRSVGMFE